MILAEHTKDAKFYSLVHAVLDAERRRELNERRSGNRSPYRCIQLIAPLVEDRLPDRSEFRCVQCVDLSPSGLAYLSHEPPRSRRVIVVLGADQPLCLSADVVRYEPVIHDGAPAYRVACRFAGRIEGCDVEPPAAPDLRG